MTPPVESQSVSLAPARLAVRITQLFSCEQPKQFARNEFRTTHFAATARATSIAPILGGSSPSSLRIYTGTGAGFPKVTQTYGGCELR
jgi:hypothetical protein